MLSVGTVVNITTTVRVLRVAVVLSERQTAVRAASRVIDCGLDNRGICYTFLVEAEVFILRTAFKLAVGFKKPFRNIGSSCPVA